MKKLIVIVGPTASGKTKLALKLAKKFSGEIVSADSRQVYRDLDIGTAKPTKKETTSVKHHLIDIKNPDQNYTVWQFKKDAVAAIDKIIKKDKTAFLVGGSGLYIKAVVDNLDIPKVEPDLKLRRRLEVIIENEGLGNLYAKLVKIDPESAYIVDPQNPRRVIRALEVAIKTKRPFSRQYKKRKPLFEALQIGLNPGREKLKEKIEKRADEMLKKGLVKEVENLVKSYDKNLPVFDAIGYREVINYFDKKISLAEAVEKIKKNTWHFAKRQMVWFKKDKRIHWIKNQKQAEKLIKNFL
jgi:tRNA dimethylallyltransferase